MSVKASVDYYTENVKVSEVVRLNPPHGVENEEAVKVLAKSILECGWEGPPIVLWGQGLITGTHRHAALESIEDDLGRDFEVPTIEIQAVFEADEKDFEDLFKEYGSPSFYELPSSGLLDELSEEIKTILGIQY